MAPPKSHEAAVEDFISSITMLIRRIRADAPPEHRDFSQTQKNVVKRLELEGPMTTADLARAEGVKPQSMGTVIAGLEELGFIQRRPHPSDGRQMNLQLSTKGIALRQKMKEVRSGWISEALSRLDKDDRAALLRAGEIIKHMIENY